MLAPPTEQAIKQSPPHTAALGSLVFTPKFLSMWLMILNSAVSGISIAGARLVQMPPADAHPRNLHQYKARDAGPECGS
jgi:hypothetical protein